MGRAEIHSYVNYKRKEKPAQQDARGMNFNLIFVIKSTHRYKHVELGGLSCLADVYLVVCMPPSVCKTF